MKQNKFKSPGGRKRFLVFILLAAVALFALGGIVMLLWNAILPPLLNVSLIGYWQAVGLLLLCKILFSSFGPATVKGGRSFGGPPRHIRERFMNMSDEEKAALKEKWQTRCAERKK